MRPIRDELTAKGIPWLKLKNTKAASTAFFTSRRKFSYIKHVYAVFTLAKVDEQKHSTLEKELKPFWRHECLVINSLHYDNIPRPLSAVRGGPQIHLGDWGAMGGVKQE